jgi:hypothetical protein
MAFGTGLGAFMQGFGGGYSMGRGIRQDMQQRRDENTIRKAQKEAWDDASEARKWDMDMAKTMDSMDAGAREVQTNAGLNSDLAQMPLYGGAREAQTSAKLTPSPPKASQTSQIGSIMDYYRQTSAPKVVDAYMKIGQPEKAAAFQEYIDGQEGKADLKQWAKGWKSFATGDVDGGMQTFGKLLAKAAPGVKFGGYTPIMEGVYDPDTGKKIGERETGGYAVQFTRPDGTNFTQEFSSQRDMLNVGVSTFAPDKLFDYVLGRQKAADETSAEIGKENRKFGHDRILKADEYGYKSKQEADKNAFTLARDKQQHGYTIDENNNASRNRITERGIDFDYDMKGKRFDADTKKAGDDADRAAGDRKAIAAIASKLMGGNDPKTGKPYTQAAAIKDALSIYNQSGGTAGRGVR